MSNQIQDNLLINLATSVAFGAGYFIFNKISDITTLQKDKNTDLLFKYKSWADIKTNVDCALKLLNEKDINPIDVLKILQKKNIVPDINTYNSILEYSINNGFYNEFEYIKKEILDEFFPEILTEKTMEILLLGLCIKYKLLNKNSKLKEKFLSNQEDITFHQCYDNELKNIINKFEEHEIFLNVESINLILETLINLERYEEAEIQIKILKNENLNQKSLDLICLFIERKKSKSNLIILEEIIEKIKKLDLECVYRLLNKFDFSIETNIQNKYTSLIIILYCKQSDQKKLLLAYKIYEENRRKDQINQIIVKILYKALLKNKFFDKAEIVLTHIEDQQAKTRLQSNMIKILITMNKEKEACENMNSLLSYIDIQIDVEFIETFVNFLTLNKIKRIDLLEKIIHYHKANDLYINRNIAQGISYCYDYIKNVSIYEKYPNNNNEKEKNLDTLSSKSLYIKSENGSDNYPPQVSIYESAVSNNFINKTNVVIDSYSKKNSWNNNDNNKNQISYNKKLANFSNFNNLQQQKLTQPNIGNNSQNMIYNNTAKYNSFKSNYQNVCYHSNTTQYFNNIKKVSKVEPTTHTHTTNYHNKNSIYG